MTDTKRTWFLWSGIIFVILFISLIIYAIFLYMDLNEKRTADFDATSKEIVQQTPITEVSKIEKFSGEEAYHVVFGKNAADEEKIIFYPLDGNEKTLTTIDAKDIVSQTAMLDHWKSDCGQCELINITPALVNNEVLWELIYYDQENRYVFDYRSIYDGSRYEEIRYVRMFN